MSSYPLVFCLPGAGCAADWLHGLDGRAIRMRRIIAGQRHGKRGVHVRCALDQPGATH